MNSLIQQKTDRNPDGFSYLDEIRLLTLDTQALGLRNKGFLPPIHRTTEGLRNALRQKIKDLQTRDIGPSDLPPAQSSINFNDVQNLIDRTREQFRQFDVVDDQFDYRQELLAEIFKNEQGEPTLELGNARYLRNYSTIERQMRADNELTNRINANEIRNRASMIYFLTDSDKFLEQASLVLEESDFGPDGVGFEDLTGDIAYLQHLTLNGLAALKTYVRTKVSNQKARSAINRSMRGNPSTLNVSQLKNRTWLSEQSIMRDHETEDIPLELFDPANPLSYFLTEAQRNQFYSTIDKLKLDDSRKTEKIYELFSRFVRRFNNHFPNSEQTQQEFIVSHVNILIKESCEYLQSTFLVYVQSSYSPTPLPDASKAVSDSMGKILTYIKNHLQNFEQVYIQKDQNGIPIWALLYFSLRAGIFDQIFTFCATYSGTLEDDVKHFGVLFILYLQKTGLEFLRVKKDEVDAFLGSFQPYLKQSIENGQADDFKRSLFGLLENRETVPGEILIPRITDAIWFGLFVSYETPDAELHFRLLDLHRKIKESDFSTSPSMQLALPFYNLCALMFDECPFSILNYLKSQKDAVQIAFLTIESKLNLLIQAYQRLQSADVTIKSATKLITDFVMKLPPIQWENALTLLTCFPSPQERANVLQQYSKTHKLFTIIFDYEVPRNQIPNNFKALVSGAEFEVYVRDALREFKNKDDWRNFGCLINAHTELKQWDEVCLVFIDLKYEQVRRTCFNDISDSQKFDKTRGYVEKVFKDNIPSHFKNEPSFRAAISCEEIKTICIDFYIRKNADQFDRILSENFSSWNSAVIAENYHLLFMFLVNVAYNVCIYKYRTDRSEYALGRIGVLLDCTEKFEKRNLSDKLVKSEAKKVEWNRLKQNNGDKILEIRAICLVER